MSQSSNVKLCECGCGRTTSIAEQSNTAKGWIKDQPKRFIQGHQSRVTEQRPEPNPSGLCMCGCGQPAPIATRTNKHHGYVEGKPKRYILNHHRSVVSSKSLLPPNPSGLCMCGCGAITPTATRTTSRDGHVKGEHVKCLVGHYPRPELPERYYVDPDTGCWIWQRAYSGRPKWGTYGTFYENGKRQRAHIAMYEIKYGPVPPSKELHHRCVEEGFGSTMCCNPDHMEVVTHAINMQRSNRAKLTADEVREMRRLYLAGEATRLQLAERYGITASNASSILLRKSWRNI